MEDDIESYKDTIKRNLAVISAELKGTHNLLLEPRVVYDLAASGIHKQKICALFGCAAHYIDEDENLLAVYNQGRASIGTTIRASILDDALHKDILQAKIHLDKIYNKEDSSVQQVDVTVTQNPLENISTEELLSIDITDIESKE